MYVFGFFGLVGMKRESEGKTHPLCFFRSAFSFHFCLLGNAGRQKFGQISPRCSSVYCFAYRYLYCYI